MSEVATHAHPIAPTSSTAKLPYAEALDRQDSDGLLRLPKKRPPLPERSLYTILSQEVVVEEDTIFGPPPLERRISSLSEQPRLVRRASRSSKLLNVSGNASPSDGPPSDGPPNGDKPHLEPDDSPSAIQCFTTTAWERR